MARFSGSASAGVITIGSGAAATTLTGSAALIVATGGAAGLVIAGVGAGYGLYAWISSWPVPNDGRVSLPPTESSWAASEMEQSCGRPDDCCRAAVPVA